MTKPSREKWGGNMVGPAFTMRSIPAREDLNQLSAFDDPMHPQRKAIESVPPGHVLVLDCRGEKRVASGGQILTTRLKMRGGAGLVSNCAIRDSGAISKLDFPVYTVGNSEPLNLIHHHALDQNVPTMMEVGYPDYQTSTWGRHPRASRPQNDGSVSAATMAHQMSPLLLARTGRYLVEARSIWTAQCTSWTSPDFLPIFWRSTTESCSAFRDTYTLA